MKPRPLCPRVAMCTLALLLMTGCHFDFPRMRMPDLPSERDPYGKEPEPPALALARPNPHSGGASIPAPEPLM